MPCTVKIKAQISYQKAQIPPFYRAYKIKEQKYGEKMK